LNAYNCLLTWEHRQQEFVLPSGYHLDKGWWYG
jgi:hypothetical protein